MDKKRSILNVSVSIGYKLILMVFTVIVRRVLIQYLGNEINGLNSLYLSIIGFLSVAELGIGTAITFAMYKPIIEKRFDEVAALYQLFRKSYLIIGGIIFLAGLGVMPALPYLTKGYESEQVNLYFTFLVMLVAVVLSYTFSAKISLINAYKDDYISTLITSSCMLLQYVLQIAVLIITSSFVGFLACQIVVTLIQWMVMNIVTKKKHGDILAYKKQTLSSEAKSQVSKNIRALFIHRIGGILTNSADSLVISALIGVTMLGKFANYTTISISLTGILVLMFSPLTSVIGHMCVSEMDEAKNYFKFFHSLNYIVGTVFFLGYYSIIDNLIQILFGAGLELSKSISFVITLNYFIQFLRQATLLFKDATGTFYNDRWKPFFEGTLNVILSISLVLIFGELFGDDVGVVGVIVATIITNLTICHVVEPYVLFKHAFRQSPKKYWARNYLYIAGFICALFAMSFCSQSYDNVWLELLVNGSISVAVSAALIALVSLISKEFRTHVFTILKKAGSLGKIIKGKFGA